METEIQVHPLAEIAGMIISLERNFKIYFSFAVNSDNILTNLLRGFHVRG